MRRLLIACAVLGLAGLAAPLAAAAQATSRPEGMIHPAPAAAQVEDNEDGMTSGGSWAQHMQHRMGRDAMGQGMMMSEMCRMMGAGQMGGRAGMGMMGRMPMAPEADPKARARMLQMRGDILKAIGEVMLRYGKAMEEGH